MGDEFSVTGIITAVFCLRNCTPLSLVSDRTAYVKYLKFTHFIIQLMHTT